MPTQLEIFKQYFSEERMHAYEELAISKGLGVESAVDLYRINLLISKELYSILSCVEVALRNQIHQQLKVYKNKEDWYDSVVWGQRHEESLEDAKRQISKDKYQFEAGDLIACLNFGFWTNIFSRKYEQTLWIPCLYRLFPNKKGKTNRKELEQILKRLLKIRNRIAHYEPIIKDEEVLIECYNDINIILTWISEDIVIWANKYNKFEELFTMLQSNSFCFDEK